MFNIFIAESILKQVIETEGKKPEASRSYLYKLMRMKLMKKVYVSAETPDAAWAKTLEEQHKIKAEYSKSDYIRGIKGTVQNPKKRRTFALEISDEHDKTRSSGCRKPINPSEGGLRMLSGA